MNKSTINAASFLLSTVTTTVAGTVTYDVVSNVATFTPAAPLEHNTLYAASINAKDVAGNSLASSTWSFTTIPAPGALDAAFGLSGRIRTGLGPGDDIAYATTIQQDGKIIIAGLSSASSFLTGTNIFTIARFRASGLLDDTFGFPPNGRADYFIGRAMSVGLQPDQKIVAAGTDAETPFSPSKSAGLIARYNTDGTLDTAFGSNGTSTLSVVDGRNVINSLAIQSDGKILVAGEAVTQGTSTGMSFIARIASAGVLDTTFASNGIIRIDALGSTSWARVVKIQSDGRIVVGGNFLDAGGHRFFYLSRFESTGSPDSSFNSGSVVTSPTGTLVDIEVLSSGKILVAGTTTNSLNYSDDIFLMQFNADGTLDGTFGSSGIVMTDDVNRGVETAAGLAVDADGRLLVAATFHPVIGTILTNDFALFRYSAGGTLDTTFGSGYGMVTTDFGSLDQDGVLDMLIQQDGKILLMGASRNGSNYDIGMARYWP